MAFSYHELETRLHQFNKLMQEVLRGKLQRNTFQPWEIEILLDIDQCDLRVNRLDILRRYQKAANRYVLDRGGDSILKLSEYLAKKHVGKASDAA